MVSVMIMNENPYINVIKKNYIETLIKNYVYNTKFQFVLMGYSQCRPDISQCGEEKKMPLNSLWTQELWQIDAKRVATITPANMQEILDTHIDCLISKLSTSKLSVECTDAIAYSSWLPSPLTSFEIKQKTLNKNVTMDFFTQKNLNTTQKQILVKDFLSHLKEQTPMLGQTFHACREIHRNLPANPYEHSVKVGGYYIHFGTMLKRFIESSSRQGEGGHPKMRPEDEFKYLPDYPAVFALYAETMGTYPIEDECVQAILALKDYYDTKEISKTQAVTTKSVTPTEPTFYTTTLDAEAEEPTTPIVGILFLVIVLIGALYGYIKFQKKKKRTNEYGQELQLLQ
jgi:hypothetical protein